MLKEVCSLLRRISYITINICGIFEHNAVALSALTIANKFLQFMANLYQGTVEMSFSLLLLTAGANWCRRLKSECEERQEEADILKQEIALTQSAIEYVFFYLSTEL